MSCGKELTKSGAKIATSLTSLLERGFYLFCTPISMTTRTLTLFAIMLTQEVLLVEEGGWNQLNPKLEVNNRLVDSFRWNAKFRGFCCDLFPYYCNSLLVTFNSRPPPIVVGGIFLPPGVLHGMSCPCLEIE